jgi:hypothetical protein
VSTDASGMGTMLHRFSAEVLDIRFPAWPL